MVDAARHPRIKLMTYSEVKEIRGFVGNFRVTIEQKTRYVTDFCNACGDCVEVCPIKVPNEHIKAWHTGTLFISPLLRRFP